MARAAAPPSLPTALSQALIAFTIEFDNEFEHRVDHRTSIRKRGAGPPDGTSPGRPASDVAAVLAEAYNWTMPHRLALVCGLILVAGLSAGCGGGSQAAVRQEAKQLLGDGTPEILRIEDVRDLAGNQLVIATLKGHFRFPLPNGPCGEQCRTALRTPRSYVWLSFSQSQPKESYGFDPTTASEIAAINNAHSARQYFSVFPNSAATAILCAVPRGNSSATVPGHCSTTLVGPSLIGSSHVTDIRFHEAWGLGHRRDGGWSRHQRGGGWIVALDRGEHVQSIRRFGDLPPQLWK